MEIANVQMQNGGDDCGLFAIAFAFSLCAGDEPTELNYTQHKLHDHLVSCLENISITRFPTTRRRKHKHKNTISFKIPVYCICRQPDSGKMVECGQCKEWYHDDCIAVPKDVWKKRLYSWICDKCHKP